LKPELKDRLAETQISPVPNVLLVSFMTLWFYVKTPQDPKAVGEVVCNFNITSGEHPEDKYTWILQEGPDEPDYWEIKGKYAPLKALSVIGIVYRIGDTVVFSEIDDDLAPNFADPLITKYGFDNVKWMYVQTKR
jgi:hypothetical protein